MHDPEGEKGEGISVSGQGWEGAIMERYLRNNRQL